MTNVEMLIWYLNHMMDKYNINVIGQTGTCQWFADILLSGVVCLLSQRQNMQNKSVESNKDL